MGATLSGIDVSVSIHCSIKASACQYTIACHDYELAVIITQVPTCRPDGVNNERAGEKGSKDKGARFFLFALIPVVLLGF